MNTCLAAWNHEQPGPGVVGWDRADQLRFQFLKRGVRSLISCAALIGGPNHPADKVSEHVCRLICLCIDYRVIGEISGGDTATGLERVLASMRIQKKEFDDVTNTYESLV